MTIIAHDINSNTADDGRLNPPLPSVSLPKAGAVPPTVPADGSNFEAGQFQDLRDTDNLIKSKPGMFWCYTHMTDLPTEKQSIDKRYCQRCYEVLADEADDSRPQDTSEGSGGYHRAQLAVVKRQRKYQSVMTLA